ncbi:MAG: RdgB/HAM1 family non-canonical purine NTP pyrophosphatase [Chloroflexi bacterium]|nr:RdgB/HAM1 family non-canonical purine NTP pyrophosphatase [Chloroflexota bacterium]
MLLIATNNQHKVSEFRRLLGDMPCRLVTPRDVGLELDVEEDGVTFAENAAKKARVFAAATGLLSLADDSGIEVDALDGRPGVYSARYGGPELSDEGRVHLMLRELVDVPVEQRGCRYVAVIAIAWPDGRLEQFEDACEGRVAFEPSGANGFGYDPVFYVPSEDATMAEISSEAKDRISHRGIAVRKAADSLRRAIADPNIARIDA